MPIKTRGKDLTPVVAELLDIRRLLNSDNTPLAVRVYLKARRTAILNTYRRGANKA